MRTTRIGLTLAAMLMACGAAQAQVSDDAVKIGVLTDHSGGFAYLVGKHSVEAAQIGRARRIDDARGRYIHSAKSSFPDHLRLDDLKVVVDCANGAAYSVAPEALWELGAEVIPVESGGRGLKDAVNEALRDWTASFDDTHYLLGTVAGPHPFPLMVREYQRVIGKEARAQMLEDEGRLPDAVIAAVGGGSNAMGIFSDFVADEGVRLIGVEAAGRGLDGNEHGATILRGRPGILHGCETYVLQDGDGQISESWSVSAGLDYPAVGPEHAHLKDSGRAEYVGATDQEALNAFALLARSEGIICAFESAHALAHALKMAEDAPEGTILLVNLSGRGDKDMVQAQGLLNPSA